jgi:hypothetical protein
VFYGTLQPRGAEENNNCRLKTNFLLSAPLPILPHHSTLYYHKTIMSSRSEVSSSDDEGSCYQPEPVPATSRRSGRRSASDASAISLGELEGLRQDATQAVTRRHRPVQSTDAPEVSEVVLAAPRSDFSQTFDTTTEPVVLGPIRNQGPGRAKGRKIRVTINKAGPELGELLDMAKREVEVSLCGVC